MFMEYILSANTFLWCKLREFNVSPLSRAFLIRNLYILAFSQFNGIKREVLNFSVVAHLNRLNKILSYNGENGNVSCLPRKLVV